MKKLLLFLFAGGMAMGANAQNATQSIVQNGYRQSVESVRPANVPHHPHATNTANKGTGGVGTRWFSYYDWVDTTNSGSVAANSFLYSIWFDSTVVVNYTTGPSAINFASVSQVMDPISNPLIFDDPGLYPGELDVVSTLPYTVDSVYFVGSYVREVTRPGTIVDTLILSIAPSTGIYQWDKVVHPEAAPYLSASQDTLFALTQFNVDETNRALITDVAGTPEKTWKIPLTNLDGDTADAGGLVSVQAFAFEVPGGGITIPAGNNFCISLAFKSGDTWVANVDSVNMFHRFLPMLGEAAPNARMPYYWYDYGDQNMSDLMFTTDPTFYAPTILVEATNTIGFSQEFLDCGAHITQAVGVNDFASVAKASAYPNPANNVVTVPVTLKVNGTVNVTLTNTIGAVVAAQNLGTVQAGQTGKASFNTASLASGVYFYTVEVNGQRMTNRVAIAH
jgi:hypothetical protein